MWPKNRGWRGEIKWGFSGEFGGNQGLLPLVFGPFGLEVTKAFFGSQFGDGREAVDEEDAVEVVGFVLEGAGEKAVGFEGDMASVKEGEVGGDLGGAVHLFAEVGDAEAAFKVDIAAAAEVEFRVDEDEGHPVVESCFLAVDPEVGAGVLGAGDVNDGELDGDGDLGRGEADAVGVFHGFDHITGEGFEIRGDLGNEFALGSEDRVAVEDDFADHGMGREMG